MELSGISSGFTSLMDSGSVKGFTRRSAAAAAEDLAATQETPAALTAGAPSGSASSSGRTNMMARNFTGAASEESRYIKARKDAFAAEESARNSFMNIVQGLQTSKAAQGVDGSRYCDSVNQAETEMALRREKIKRSHEESERNLEEMRERLVERTREITVPTDAEGNPVPAMADMEAGAAPAAEPVPVPVAYTASGAPAMAPEAALPAGPSTLAQPVETPRLDITV